MKIYPALLICGLLSSCTSSSPPAPDNAASEVQASAVNPLPQSLEEAVKSNFRSPKNQARDSFRHPLETLTFFGIKPDMTVVEISPGAGWYTEILAPYLSAKGKYIAAIVPAEKSDYAKASAAKLDAWFKSYPTLVANYGAFSPPLILNITSPNSADMVLTFRNVHNWMGNAGEAQAFAAFYAALKPGGILGVVEHRANEKGKADPKGTSGYVKESKVINLASAAGFKLEAKSEINANPKDTKIYPEGVWTLPPTLALKDKDREKYLKIGESDRMTLRFIKPKK